MTRLKEIVQWQTNSGKKVTEGDITVTPQSRVLIIRWPFGGLVWNRPIAVQVERSCGADAERLPVVDLTRLVQVGLLGLSVLFWLIGLAQLIQQRRA